MVNATKCLNLIGEPNMLHQSFTPFFAKWWELEIITYTFCKLNDLRIIFLLFKNFLTKFY